jgi:hypothetical protein
VTLKFGTDGVRGVALVELTTLLTTALGEAAAHVIGGDRWLVARDTRESGPSSRLHSLRGLRPVARPSSCSASCPRPALAHLARARRSCGDDHRVAQPLHRQRREALRRRRDASSTTTSRPTWRPR